MNCSSLFISSSLTSDQMWNHVFCLQHIVRFPPCLSKKSGKALQDPRWSTPIHNLLVIPTGYVEEGLLGASFTLSGSFLKDQLEILVFETRRCVCALCCRMLECGYLEFPVLRII